MSGLPVHVSGAATVDGNGRATALLTVPWPQTWRVTRMSTTGTSVTTPGQLLVWRGLTGTLLGTSANATADTSAEEGLTLATGETVRAEWRACQPGTEMQFTIEGVTA